MLQNWLQGVRARQIRVRRQQRLTTSAQVQMLEPRVMLSATVTATSEVVEMSTEQLARLESAEMGVSLAVDPSKVAAMASELASVNGPFPDSDTFLLNSRPNATKTIYLDFDGHLTTGTAWNVDPDINRSVITSPAFDIDGDVNSFSSTELGRIQQIWQRVAEAFSPFDVNVTTQEPPLSDLQNAGDSDTRWGVRVAIGGTNVGVLGPALAGAGGVAYLYSFSDDIDTPAFVFEENLGNGNEKFTADAIVHEVGHTLGLLHDGRTTPAEEYYEGHGSGTTGWAPIMGAGYYENVVQWSRGEYPNASNTEDDLSIITTQNGFGYRIDDYGNSSTTATELVAQSSLITADGVIETSTDTDWFSITTTAGFNLTFSPAERGAMLDISASLYDSNNTLIATSNPQNLLSATLSSTLAGTFYIRIDGVGKAAAGNDFGYSDYGSLGQYSITGGVGTVNDPDDQLIEAVAIGSTDVATGDITAANDVDMYYFTVVAGERVEFDIDRPSGSLDSYLRIFNGSGGQLAANDDGPTPNENSSLESYVAYTFTTAGTYYVGVSAYPNTLYNAITGENDTGNTSTGAYTLSLTRASTTNRTPTNLNVSPASVAENSPFATTVGTLSTTDPDAGNTFTYTFAPGTGSEGNTFFQIVGDQLQTAAIFDYEAQSSYTIRVRTTDQGGLSFEKTLLINIEDVPENRPPTNINLSSTAIGENQPFNSVVGSLSTVDPDAANTFTYTLVSGTGDTHNGSFNIAGNQLRSAETFDFEAQSSYSIRVRSTDQGGLFYDRSFVISITNNNDAPVFLPQAFNVSENSTAGTVVGNIAYSDVEGDQVHTFRILSGNTNDVFSIDNSSGQITVRTPSALDYETRPVYSLRVEISDNGVPRKTTTATVTINLTNANEAPQFSPISPVFSVTENSVAGSIVGTLNVVDPDAATTLTYELIGGNTGGAFSINAAGQIRVQTVAAVNFEIQPKFELQVRVTDSGAPALSTTGTVTINVTNVNEMPVVAATSFATRQLTRRGQLIGNVPASDPDAGQRLTYAIVGGNTGSLFAINASTGVISANRLILLAGTYRLTVRATDNGSPAASGTGVITIYVNRTGLLPAGAVTAPVVNNSSSSSSTSSATTAVSPIVVAPVAVLPPVRKTSFLAWWEAKQV